MHWTDDILKKLLMRGDEHVIETGTSISGIPHIGNAADVIRGDAVRKVLAEKGVRAGFIWVADDSDPFRKVPAGMEKLRNYLGFPVKDIPDPDGCHRNFVDHFVEPFIEDLEIYGIKPDIYSSTELYRGGEFRKEIRKALDESEKIIGILNESRKEPLTDEFIAWAPICEGCGRISTTKVYGRDADIVEYRCEDTVVSGNEVKGCGYRGESDINKGEGKLPWRVEWAARWKHFRVTCEPLGKEHASSGGSFWTSQKICREVFKWDPPVPLIYEFFTMNGQKISSSKGNVITLRDWLDICEPEVLKYFMYKRLMKQRDINLRRIPSIVDEYDRAEEVYFGIQEGDVTLKRGYELAQIEEPSKLGIPYTMCAVMAQIVPDLNVEDISKRLERQGYHGFDKKRLEKRLKVAGEWNRIYGPEYLNFTISSERDSRQIKKKLGDKEKKALREIADELDREQTPEEFHRRIYEISRANSLDPAKLFQAIYRILIGKDRGPKAASFLLTLEKDFIRERFM